MMARELVSPASAERMDDYGHVLPKRCVCVKVESQVGRRKIVQTSGGWNEEEKNK